MVLGRFTWFRVLVTTFFPVIPIPWRLSSPPENQNLISSAGNVLWCCISLNIV